jgi:hypothetical protein
VKDQRLFDLEREARAAKVGIWGLSETQQMPPWEWRRSGGTKGAPEGCLIKGNISSKGNKIYHRPGSSSYGATKINEAKASPLVFRQQWPLNEVRFPPESRRQPMQVLDFRCRPVSDLTVCPYNEPFVI